MEKKRRKDSKNEIEICLVFTGTTVGLYAISL